MDPVAMAEQAQHGHNAIQLRSANPAEARGLARYSFGAVAKDQQ